MTDRSAVVTCDLDSTLCDTGHRHKMIDRVNGTDWHAYSQACIADERIEATVAVIKALYPMYQIHFVSGRTESARPETEKWLEKNEIPSDGLWLDDGPAEDYAHWSDHAQYKLARIRDVEAATGLKVVLHIDDWAGVKVLLEKNGIPCLCVRTPQEVIALVEQDSEL